MFAVLKKDWKMINGENGEKVVVPKGRHELERIDNPFGYKDAPWLVLKGTKIGQAEGAWRQWKNGKIANNPKHPNYGKPIDWKECEIIIEE